MSAATIACTLAGRVDRAPGVVSFRLLRAACLEIGVPESQVRSEGFVGY